MTHGTSQIDETTFRQKNDVASIRQSVAIHLRLDCVTSRILGIWKRVVCVCVCVFVCVRALESESERDREKEIKR